MHDLIKAKALDALSDLAHDYPDIEVHHANGITTRVHHEHMTKVLRARRDMKQYEDLPEGTLGTPLPAQVSRLTPRADLTQWHYDTHP
jgi:hypothetical protein